ncbi:hypothetical protein NAT51_15130 [Flavobacterium amniphilum]|uniref:hypothetical protein n=1 Tax=Flavobacterium amniphilum TaxID=1834035 RepID=UPI00202A2765|nr:hypothetical protein [Flavobacterium amniphilum]MCL9806867.1 hypothetical protein [Flavobacterium amniphilum]
MKIDFKIILFLLFFGTFAKAQTYRFEVSAVSMSVKDKGKWSSFTPFKEAKIIANLNTQKNYIAVYSEIEQYFKIVKYYDKKEEDGKEIVGFDCVDQNAEPCFLEIQTRKKENMSQLYINYPDRIFVYNMRYVKK